MQNLKLERKRYVVMTSDRKKIFCGLARHYELKNVDEIGDTPIKTYMSENKARSSFISSWWNVTKDDFSSGGKYVVIQVVESIMEV